MRNIGSLGQCSTGPAFDGFGTGISLIARTNILFAEKNCSPLANHGGPEETPCAHVKSGVRDKATEALRC